MKTNPFHYSIATRIRNSYFLKYLNPVPQDKILDIGCGIGYFSKLLSDRGAEIWGIDIDPESVNICCSTIGNNFQVGNAESLNFKKNTFNKILCSEVLEHVKNDQKSLKEMFRVIRPGGTLVVTVPSIDGVFGATIKNFMHNHADGPEKHEREGYSRREIVDLISDAGFKIETTKYTMVFLTEIIMGLTKLAYSIKTDEKHLDSQTDVMKVKRSKLFTFYKLFFSLLLFVAKIDDILFSWLLKGHMIVIKAIKQ